MKRQTIFCPFMTNWRQFLYDFLNHLPKVINIDVLSNIWQTYVLFKISNITKTFTYHTIIFWLLFYIIFYLRVLIKSLPNLLLNKKVEKNRKIFWDGEKTTDRWHVHIIKAIDLQIISEYAMSFLFVCHHKLHITSLIGRNTK